MRQKYGYFLGWDVSKNDVNYCLMDHHGDIRCEGKIDNKVKQLKKGIKAFLTEQSIDHRLVLVVVENTGLFGSHLLRALHELKLATVLEDAARIGKANARQQDKTDRLDAQIIARYGLEKGYCLSLWEPESELMAKLKQLHRRRKILVKTRRSLQLSHQESTKFEQTRLPGSVEEKYRAILADQKRLIDQIDDEITKLILEDPQKAHLYRITRSVSGMGPKNTLVVLLCTNFFNKISTAKACCNYAGLRPITRESGSSVRKRKRVSKQTNKELKTAFHHAAFAMFSKKGHFKDFYERKISQGKTHLQALNAIRNKICRALYACIKNDVMYEKNRQVSLEMT